MLDKKFVSQLREAVAEYDKSRRIIIGMSDDIRNGSKRAIFAMHREDLTKADELLAVALQSIADVQKSMGTPKLRQEGSFRAALEEYVEARLYRDYLDGKELGAVEIEGIDMPHDVYLGGLSDVTGELQRKQVRLATAGDLEGVQAIRDAIEEIIGEMMEIDLTGYLRNKFDQSKNSFRRAEEVLYELAVRRG